MSLRASRRLTNVQLLSGLSRRRRATIRPPAGLPGAAIAFVTQKTVLDYCRVKAGRREKETFADPDFRAALAHCRWQTFAGAVADMAAIAEAWLRPHATGREAALAAALGRMGAAILAAAPTPPEERASLEAAADALPRHLAGLQEAPPRPADRLPPAGRGAAARDPADPPRPAKGRDAVDPRRAPLPRRLHATGNGAGLRRPRPRPAVVCGLTSQEGTACRRVICYGKIRPRAYLDTN
jgi:hypothetical protein